jgi:hypothetical protein
MNQHLLFFFDYAKGEHKLTAFGNRQIDLQPGLVFKSGFYLGGRAGMQLRRAKKSGIFLPPVKF